MNSSFQRGISLDAFARQTGFTRKQLVHYCRAGRIEGARFDRLLWQWRIYPPAKLFTGGRS